MSILRRPGVAPFLFIEGVLYAVYLWRDLAAWGDGSSVPLKYAALRSIRKNNGFNILL